MNLNALVVSLMIPLVVGIALAEEKTPPPGTEPAVRAPVGG